MDSNEKEKPGTIHGFAMDNMTVSHLESAMRADTIQKTVTLSHVAEALRGTQVPPSTRNVQNQETDTSPQPAQGQSQSENKS